MDGEQRPSNQPGAPVEQETAFGPSATTALRGDHALAVGAMAAGVRVVTGYPGSPATGVFDHLLELAQANEAAASSADGDAIHVEWAPNEKVAMELAFGASLAGSRALVVLKSVGMNIALDPLATMSLSGCHAGLVILLGDDPGGWASQNEQDSRWTARVAEVPVIEPTGVEEAASLMVQAFAWSESLGLPVIVRVTRAMTLAHGAIEPPWQLPEGVRGFYRKRNRWIVLPASVVASHRRLHRRLLALQAQFESSPYDVSRGSSTNGVLAVGFAHTKLVDTLGPEIDAYRVLGLSSAWPLPEESLAGWLRQVERVLILEEGGPFVEQEVRALAQRHGIEVTILGREDRIIPTEGELTAAEIAEALTRLTPSYQPEDRGAVERTMPSRVPLCDDCPYRPTFEALLSAMDRQADGDGLRGRQRHIVVGETGCMVRANLPPMELFDVKYSLGAGLGLAMGLALRDRKHHVVALVGDSSFFHTGINAMPYAAQLNLPMTVIVLDNGVTALTGGQAHPGSAADARGRPQRPVDLEDVIRGCGVEPALYTPDQADELEDAIDAALGADIMRVIIVRGPCPRYLPTGERGE